MTVYQIVATLKTVADVTYVHNMAKEFLLTTETLGYVTADDQTNTDDRHLVAGSQNVLIDRERKVVSRNGYSRLGAANSAINQVRSSVGWNTSTGSELILRVYDDELEVYLGTVGITQINGWRRVLNGISTLERARFTTWYDDAEAIDVLLFVLGDPNIYEWSGAVAIVSSFTVNTITKEGTTTWGQDRFFANSNQTLVNVRNGNEHTYTGGLDSTTLTGLNNTTDMQVGDLLMQKVVTNANTPDASINNHTIFTFENQVGVGSDENEEALVSQNDDFTDFTFSSPRVPGEGGILTLDDPVRGFGALSDRFVIFAGENDIYNAEYFEITVGSTLTETLNVRKLKTGVSQGAFSQEFIVPVGNSLMYLTNEPTLRELTIPENIEGPQLRTLSNPIRPDFDAENWTNGEGIWYRNALYLTAPTNGRQYVLEFVEDADGRLRRFWQPPQILPVRSLTIFQNNLYGHSNGSPETYRLYDPDAFSDVNSADEKLPITARANFAYRNYDDRANLKNFDEYFVEGEISPATDLGMTLNYDFGGQTAQIIKIIEGDDFDILAETLDAVSLAQQPLGQQPLGGNINAPDNTAKFRVIFELAREDFHEIQASFETDDVDKYWSILSHGPNAGLSRRLNSIIKK